MPRRLRTQRSAQNGLNAGLKTYSNSIDLTFAFFSNLELLLPLIAYCTGPLALMQANIGKLCGPRKSFPHNELQAGGFGLAKTT